jgi:hypothetical protein
VGLNSCASFQFLTRTRSRKILGVEIKAKVYRAYLVVEVDENISVAQVSVDDVEGVHVCHAVCYVMTNAHL